MRKAVIKAVRIVKRLPGKKQVLLRQNDGPSFLSYDLRESWNQSDISPRACVGLCFFCQEKTKPHARTQGWVNVPRRARVWRRSWKWRSRCCRKPDANVPGQGLEPSRRYPIG